MNKTFTEKQVEKYKQAIRAYKNFQLTQEEVFFVRAGINDLYFGPRETQDGDLCEYSWKKALEVCENAWNRINPGKSIFWDGEIEELLFSEPEGEENPETGEYEEPFWEFFFEVDEKELKRIIFGKEFSKYF